MLLTYFKAREIGKMPFSKDNLFDFYQKDVELTDFPKINKDYWIMNGNFKFPSNPFKSKRNKVYLKDYLTDEFQFIILDFDEVNNKINIQNIIEILKQENFHFILWESSSHNGIDNFNLKGALEARGKNNDASLNKLIRYIDSLLKDFCKVDYSSVRQVMVQKPTHKEKVIFYNKGNNIPEYYFEDKKITFISNNAFLNLCIKIYEKLGFYVCKDNEKIINLGHPKEKTKCGYFVFKDNPQVCHHFNKAKTFSIYEYIKSDPIFKEYNQNKILKEFENKIFIPVKNKVTFNQRYIDISKLDINIENDEVIYVKSPMGTGKTNIIKKLQKDKRTLIITNRITLAEEYKEKFPNFKLYNKDLYFNGDSYITQYDSLHKVDLKNFDLFVIDEFMSLIDHSLSGLTEYKDINNLKLYYILKKLKTPLLIMDAFLTGIETQFVKRGKYKYFENLYRDNNNLFIYNNVNCFINSIENVLGNSNKKVTLSTTNKSFAKVVYEIFKSKFKVALLTGDTDNKNFYTQHFNKATHNEWDLLIYTPTITTGVNILNESDHHFHYSDGTGSVISSLQQIKRNRNAQNIHFFLKNKRYNRIVNYEELVFEIEKQLKKFAVRNSFLVEFDEYANPKLNSLGKWQIRKIYLNNLLNTNPIYSFKMFLKYQFSKELKEIKNCKADYNVKSIKEKIKLSERKQYLEKIDDLLNSDSFDFLLKYETNFKEVKEKLDKYFTNLTENDIKEIIQIISKDKKFLDNIKYLKLYHSSEENLKELIGLSLVENLNKSMIRNLELLYKFRKKGFKLKNQISISEAKDKEFRKFINLIGYKKYKNVYKIKDTIYSFLNKIKIG